jgi:hypothetical protein
MRPSEAVECTPANAKPGEFLIRIRRNVQTDDGNNGIPVEVQARVTNDQARDDDSVLRVPFVTTRGFICDKGDGMFGIEPFSGTGFYEGTNANIDQVPQLMQRGR